MNQDDALRILKEMGRPATTQEILAFAGIPDTERERQRVSRFMSRLVTFDLVRVREYIPTRHSLRGRPVWEVVE